MNQSNAHLYLPLVQALADGRAIQRRDCGKDWADASELDFTFEAVHVREVLPQ